MAEAKPLSVSKLVAALGGALLMASFFLPLVSAAGREDVRRELFGVKGLRAQIEAQRELAVVQPMIEPALQAIETFTEMPSLRNLSSLAAASTELLDKAADFGVPQAKEMRQASTVLTIARICLWWLPLVGAVQVLAPMLTRMRGYAGFFGLVTRFFFGLGFALLALVPLIGAPSDQQANIGPAVWVLLVGSLLMMVASLAGVTRSNWWMVLLADLAIFGATIGGLVAVAEAVSHR
jgi:hypothetical protein